MIRLELTVILLDRQLEQTSRISGSAEFQKAAAAWTTKPTGENLKALFCAERDVMPGLRIR